MANSTASKPETCRLTLTIGRRSYALRRLKADAREFGVTRAYRLRRTDNAETYTVARLVDGGVSCDCPDACWRHDENNSKCKHSRALAAWGLL